MEQLSFLHVKLIVNFTKKLEYDISTFTNKNRETKLISLPYNDFSSFETLYNDRGKKLAYKINKIYEKIRKY